MAVVVAVPPGAAQSTPAPTSLAVRHLAFPPPVHICTAIDAPDRHARIGSVAHGIYCMAVSGGLACRKQEPTRSVRSASNFFR